MKAAWIDALWRRVPWIFAVLALAASTASALVLPPFMAPDEPAHAYRAVLPTLGAWTPHRLASGPAGGAVDRSLVELFDVYEPIRHHPERQVGPDHAARAARLQWDGRILEAEFPNTAIYSPAAYIPATLGLAAGKAAQLSVADSVRLARVINGVVCVALAALALTLAGANRTLMAAVMLLPMSTFLFGAIGQDGVMLACTAVGTALLARGRCEGRALSDAELWMACLAFTVVGLAKLPYAVFGLGLLLAQHPSRVRKLTAALAPLVIGGVWMVWMHAALNTATEAGRGVDAAGQAAWLLGDPQRLPRLAIDTLLSYGPSYVKMFIGVLGWMDTPLAPAVYATALAALVTLVATMLAAGRGAFVLPLRDRLAMGLLAAAAVGGVFAAFYLTWTPVGAPRVEGIQGRYLLAPAIFLCAAFDAEEPPHWAKGVGVSLVCLIGLLGAGALIHALLVRF